MIIQPMLLKKVNKLPEEDGYIYEEKADGGRVLAYVRDGKVKLYTRSGNNVAIQFPEIVADLKHFPDCILDGEVVVYNNGKTDFNLYQKRVMITNPFQIRLRAKTMPATYIVFDILQMNGNDLTYNTLMERKKVLQSLLPAKRGCIEPIIFDITPHFLLQIRDKIEGIVAKKKDSIYEAGKRSGAWIKYRFVKEAIVEAVEYEITPSGIVAIDEAGHRITINGRQAEAVRRAIDEEGKARLEINYYEKSREGRFRFPSFKRMLGG